MPQNPQTRVFATRHINVLRGALFSAVAALAAGLVELFSDAWIMEYAIGSPMILIVAGFAVISGCNAFLQGSVRIEIGEDHLRVSQGYRLLTGRWITVPWHQIHTATLVLSPGERGVVYRYLHRHVRDSVTLQYRWPERKMVAVPLAIPLGGFGGVPDLLKWIEQKAGPNWKVYQGGLGAGERSSGREVIELAETTFAHLEPPLPQRNESESARVLEDRER